MLDYRFNNKDSALDGIEKRSRELYILPMNIKDIPSKFYRNKGLYLVENQ